MKANYDNIKYPFHTLPNGTSVLDAFADLGQIPIFHEKEGLPTGVDNEFVMRYIILMYSNGSPAVRNFPAIGKRKTFVMNELGVLPNDKKEYPDGYNEILQNRNGLVLQKIAAFLMLQSPASWDTWLRAEEQLYSINVTQFPTDPKEANERIELVNALNKQIDEHKKKVLEYEQSLQVESATEYFMAISTLGLRPEERVLLGLKPSKPKDVKAGVIFKEVKN
jgi:recombinational DNA repair ATPase RecF